VAGRTVVVFTAEFDVTADCVIMELNQRGVPVFRCDPADYPHQITIGARFGPRWTGYLRTTTRTLDLDDVSCAWWRRPGKIRARPEIVEPDWATREANAGFRGLVATLPWLNSPDDIRRAEHKPLQLTTAAQVGLSVPPTLLTNDPDEARDFANEHGSLIYKPLTSGILGNGTVIYASDVDISQLDEGLRATTHMFQPRIQKAFEVRATVVDGQIFAARIDALTETGQRDWRADYNNLRYSPHQIPEPTADRLRRFAGRMRLRFTAIDLIVTPDGEYVFLEANPNGQWAWLEEAAGLPIAKTIADAMEGRTIT
jgi:ATP-grasp ribosomal peptide maturase